jgi:hypothetical protein
MHCPINTKWLYKSRSPYSERPKIAQALHSYVRDPLENAFNRVELIDLLYVCIYHRVA